MPRANETPSERQTRLRTIRAAIAAGTYDTPERLALAVDAMLAEFEGGAESADGEFALGE